MTPAPQDTPMTKEPTLREEDVAYIEEQIELCATHDDQPDDGLMQRILATYAECQRLSAVIARLTEQLGSKTYLYEVDALRARLDAAEQDGKRLDWLESRANGWQGVTREQIDNEDVRLDWVGDETSGLKPCSSRGRTVRAAIDAAMGARGEG